MPGKPRISVLLPLQDEATLEELDRTGAPGVRGSSVPEAEGDLGAQLGLPLRGISFEAG